MRHSVLPPASLAQIVALLSSLDEQQFGLLKTATGSARSFELPASARDRLSSDLKLSQETISYVLSALSFLYRQLRPDPAEDESTFVEKVTSVLEDLKISDAPNASFDSVRTRLVTLLQYSKNHELFLKVSRLEAGFIASLTGAASFVDLRPSFSVDRTEVEGYVPVIQMNISTDSLRNFESQLVFQLDLEGLEIMKKAIADIDTKLAVLRKQSELFLPMLTTTPDEP
jgi:hypothetical protein